jgi:two-component system sensor histidine kinase QseC
LKLRFFVTIFLVLLVAAGCVSYIHFYFFRTERFRLIDRQLEENAYILHSSELSQSQIDDIDEAEYYIGEALGIEASDLLIRIFSKRRGVIYSNYGNKNAEVLKTIQPLPEPGFRTEVVDGHTVRLLTIKLPDHKRFLEVGLLLDRHMIHWRLLSYKVFFYIGLVVILLFVSTVLLLHLLLSPLRELGAYLRYLSTRVGEGEADTSSLPRALVPKVNRAASDEFQQLVVAVQGLTNRISESLKSVKTWTAQMVHEIRTPLTIATNSLEGAQLRASDGRVPVAVVEDALAEIRRVSGVVGEFLDWAKTENTPLENIEIHAVKLGPLIEELIDRFSTLDIAKNSRHESRLALKVGASPILFSRPDLVEQVVSNLVENALRYSPGQVTVMLSDKELIVQDEGKGLPEEVRKRLGEPFNSLALPSSIPASVGALARSPDSRVRKGTGLGLARVLSICRKYGWNLNFETFEMGARVRLEFPSK